MSLTWEEAAAKSVQLLEGRATLQRRSGGNVTVVAEDLELAAWSVTVDGTRAIRRTMSATLADPDSDYVPLSASSNIAPYGIELKIETRLKSASGLYTPWASLGVFVLDKPATDDVGWLRATISGNDRAAKVAEARLVSLYTIAAGTNVATAIRDLLNSRISGLTYSFVSTTATTPLVVLNEGDDPWQRAQELASAAGLELYFDAYGVCTLRVPPDPTSSSAVIAATFEDGPDSFLMTVGVELDTEQSYSHAVFIGEGPDGTAPIRADAYDDEPTSPTYYLGAFGDKPVFLHTPLVSPDPALAASQAAQAAQALLNRKKGGFKKVTFSAIPIATLEASDLVQVTRTESGVNQLLVLDSFSFTSDLGAMMPASTRAVRL